MMNTNDEKGNIKNEIGGKKRRYSRDEEVNHANKKQRIISQLTTAFIHNLTSILNEEGEDNKQPPPPQTQPPPPPQRRRRGNTRKRTPTVSVPHRVKSYKMDNETIEREYCKFGCGEYFTFLREDTQNQSGLTLEEKAWQKFERRRLRRHRNRDCPKNPTAIQQQIKETDAVRQKIQFRKQIGIAVTRAAGIQQPQQSPPTLTDSVAPPAAASSSSSASANTNK